MSKTADIFISYRRQSAEPNAQALATLLRGIKDPKSSLKLDLFRDKRNLQPGVNWRDELKNHAKHCKVLVLLVGEDWMQRFEERGPQHIENLDPETDDIDWVAAELHYALNRDRPAKLLVVKAHQSVDVSMAASFFEYDEKVASAFKRNQLEHAVFNDGSSEEDEEALVAAVLHAYEAFSEKAPENNSSPEIRHADRSTERAHWMKFMGREMQWRQLEDKMGVPPPGKPVVGGDAIDTWATCWQVETHDDRPENLAQAISYHLAAGGAQRWATQDFTKAPAFGLRDYRDGVYQFDEIAEALSINFEIPHGCSATDAEHLIQTEFVPALVARQAAADRTGCCQCMIYTAKGRELALQVCEIWNRLQWPAMRHKFLLVFFDKGNQSQLGVIGKLTGLLNSAKRSNVEKSIVIGKLTQQCYQGWLYGFLWPEKRINISIHDPAWYEHLRSYQWPGDSRYKQIEAKLTSID